MLQIMSALYNIMTVSPVKSVACLFYILPYSLKFLRLKIFVGYA